MDAAEAEDIAPARGPCPCRAPDRAAVRRQVAVRPADVLRSEGVPGLMSTDGADPADVRTATGHPVGEVVVTGAEPDVGPARVHRWIRPPGIPERRWAGDGTVE